jgi:hypothetical protein
MNENIGMFFALGIGIVLMAFLLVEKYNEF